MKDEHAERCEYTSKILNHLIATQDEEALKAIAESAAEGIASECFSGRVHSLYTCFDHQYDCLGYHTRVQYEHTHTGVYFSYIFLCFTEHDLLKLAESDLQQIAEMKTLGKNMVQKVHEQMEVQFGHKDMGTALPDDQAQAMVVGVSKNSILTCKIMIT